MLIGLGFLLLVILEYCPVQGTMFMEKAGITNQTFPLVILLHSLEILPPKVPSQALVTECMRTEVTQVDLSSLRTPPGR